MQIYNNSLISTPASPQALGTTAAQRCQTSVNGSSPALNSPRTEVGDEVHLSDLASDLASQLAASSAAKIGRLQSAIGAGTYAISPSTIAKSIIEQSEGSAR